MTLNTWKVTQCQFGLESDLKDGSQYTKQIEAYKALDVEYEKLCELINERALELDLHNPENYFKDCSDKKLITMCNRRGEIKAEQDRIYGEIEESIKKYPEGTKFQCGDYVIVHQRAYTDENGKERMLVLKNLY